MRRFSSGEGKIRGGGLRRAGMETARVEDRIHGGSKGRGIMGRGGNGRRWPQQTGTWDRG